MVTIYLGNIPDSTDVRSLLPPSAQLMPHPAVPGRLAGIVHTHDTRSAQHIVQKLDGQSVGRHTISAIERARLEAALEKARQPARPVICMTLASRLGATSPDMLRCLQRLVTFFGTEIVTKAVDQASNRAGARKRPVLDELLDNLLCPLHPVVAQALRSGSLAQAEGELAETHTKSCQPVTNTTSQEFARRRVRLREARRELTRLCDAKNTKGPEYKRALGLFVEADAALLSFSVRFDLSLPNQPGRTWRRLSLGDGCTDGPDPA